MHKNVIEVKRRPYTIKIVTKIQICTKFPIKKKYIYITLLKASAIITVLNKSKMQCLELFSCHYRNLFIRKDTISFLKASSNL